MYFSLRSTASFCLLVLLAFLAACSSGHDDEPVTEESGPILIDDPYDLPQPLVAEDGTPILDEAAWGELRRPELLELFSTQVYGKPRNPSCQSAIGW